MHQPRKWWVGLLALAPLWAVATGVKTGPVEADVTAKARAIAGVPERKLREFQQVIDTATVKDRNEKVLVFTEHRDTLNYLAGRLRGLIGSREAVVEIHGLRLVV